MNVSAKREPDTRSHSAAISEVSLYATSATAAGAAIRLTFIRSKRGSASSTKSGCSSRSRMNGLELVPPKPVIRCCTYVTKLSLACSPSFPMSIPASSWAATTLAVASATASRSSVGSTCSPLLRLPCSSASCGGLGRDPAWVVRMRLLVVSMPISLSHGHRLAGERELPSEIDHDALIRHIEARTCVSHCGRGSLWSRRTKMTGWLLPTQDLMEVLMATVGDRVHVASRKLGQPPREGVVTGVSGRLLRVKWSTGEESTIVPGTGSVSVGGKARVSSRATKAPGRAAGSPSRSVRKAPARSTPATKRPTGSTKANKVARAAKATKVARATKVTKVARATKVTKVAKAPAKRAATATTKAAKTAKATKTATKAARPVKKTAGPAKRAGK